MKRNSPVRFADLRRFLRDLDFSEHRTDSAWAFEHAKEGLLVFRSYASDEPVDERDLVIARKFLDLRGLLEASEFDLLMKDSTAPA